ncbi:MAG: 6,7-dimethyl-8-ribityllumazine synthase [Ignavibacteriae bacterium]|nr:MAG: 6,7-dimethyl-8-ribityllumazine synthase [Ignavibacteriota bacterium]
MNPKRHTKKIFKGSASALRIALVVSRFNQQITDKLLEGAVQCLRDHGVPEKNRKLIFCPGAFELPQVANRLARQKKWDAIICLGAVIRGETPHFEYISAETARGIQDVALHFSLPVVFGVLTTNTERQALARAGGVKGNKGWDAAWTALEMAALFRMLNRKSR